MLKDRLRAGRDSANMVAEVLRAAFLPLFYSVVQRKAADSNCVRLTYIDKRGGVVLDLTPRWPRGETKNRPMTRGGFLLKENRVLGV